ncbi:MAG: phosphodiester glycosidase family protein [Candidatus Gastranaerophilales bacterium]|nr:phosphodiester glycosidase family protein [Candidatus Gastranaerophilales bacterium]
MTAKRFNYYLVLILFCCICIYGKDVSYGSNSKIVVIQGNISQPKISYVNKSRVNNPGVKHKRVKRWLNGKPAIVNILVVNPKDSGALIKPAYGSYYIGSVKSVKEIAVIEDAIAGVNASYFKPDCGTPLGTSIINGKIITGPLYRRVTLGITKNNEFKMAKLDIDGEILIGDNIKLDLFNINQPVFSSRSYSVFTDQWGKKTPITSAYYSHIVVQNDSVSYVKNSSVAIPKDGFVIVGPHSFLPKSIKVGNSVKYNLKIKPNDWDDVEYAVGGGPYLVKEGRIFIDKQKFSRYFLWTKLPRTAVGYTKKGTLVLVTIDGRHKGFSEGATITELAKIMHEHGCYNAMNLDGGTSTQMVYKGKLVNYPTVKGGSRVTNALMIIIPTVNNFVSI